MYLCITSYQVYHARRLLSRWLRVVTFSFHLRRVFRFTCVSSLSFHACRVYLLTRVASFSSRAPCLSFRTRCVLFSNAHRVIFSRPSRFVTCVAQWCKLNLMTIWYILVSMIVSSDTRSRMAVLWFSINSARADQWGCVSISEINIWNCFYSNQYCLPLR